MVCWFLGIFCLKQRPTVRKFDGWLGRPSNRLRWLKQIEMTFSGRQKTVRTAETNRPFNKKDNLSLLLIHSFQNRIFLLLFLPTFMVLLLWDKVLFVECYEMVKRISKKFSAILWTVDFVTHLCIQAFSTLNHENLWILASIDFITLECCWNIFCWVM